MKKYVMVFSILICTSILAGCDTAKDVSKFAYEISPISLLEEIGE